MIWFVFLRETIKPWTVIELLGWAPEGNIKGQGIIDHDKNKISQKVEKKLTKTCYCKSNQVSII